MTSASRRPALSLLGTALLLASCSDGSVTVHPVSGTVKVGKEIPVGAQVVLHPQGHALPSNLAPTGTVDADGKFTIGTYDVADGAPAGAYKATVLWFKMVSGAGGTGRGPNVLPAKYADPTKTPVEVTVAEGANELPPIEIARK